MDTHMKGPRGKNAQGAIPSTIIVGAKYGDAAIATVEIFRTDGANTGLGPVQPNPAPGFAKKYPIRISIFGHILTAFDGTGPVFTLTENNLDGTGGTTIASIASFAGGKFTLEKILTVDKKYSLTYTPGTVNPTVGEAYYAISVVGPGIAQV